MQEENANSIQISNAIKWVNTLQKLEPQLPSGNCDLIFQKINDSTIREFK